MSDCNSILKPKLVEMAVKKGLKKAAAQKLNKPALCDYLGITEKVSASVPMLNGRPCTPRKSSKDDYTKEELVGLAAERLNLSGTEARKLGKEQLCEKLISESKSKSPSPVKAQKKKKPAAKKKSPSPIKLSKKSGKNKSPSPVEIPKKKKSAKKAKSPSPVKPKSPSPVKPKSPSPIEAPKKKKKIKTTPVAKLVISKPSTPTPKVKGPCIERSKIPLKDHQKRIVNHLRKHRGLIAAHEMGAGKTLIAVTASQCFLDDNPKGKVIVVTPLSLQENFRKEMRAYGVNIDDSRYEFHTLHGFANTYKNQECPRNALLIIDEAHELRTEIDQALRAGRARAEKAGREDEPTVRAKIAVDCAKNVDKVLLLTGTAVYNRPRDIANLVAMVKGQDPLSETLFNRLFNDEHSFESYFKCTISFYSADKSDGYPTVQEEEVSLVMDPSYYDQYQRVEARNSDLLVMDNPWKFLAGVRQAVNALEDCPKCDWSLNKIMEGKKTLVYSDFLEFGIKRLRPILEAENIPYVEVTGEISADARARAVRDYNSDKVNVILLTKAGGLGLDLKGTRNVILMESGWSKEHEAQVIARAVRYRSHEALPVKDRNVNVYHLRLIKPPRARTTVDSADIILKKHVERKSVENIAFLEKLQKLSIEAIDCN